MDLQLIILSALVLWSSKHTETKVVAGEARSCEEFIADTGTRDLIASARVKSESCPCIGQIIAIDDTFEKKNNCYKQWFFSDDAKQVCCYSKSGQLLVDGPGTGYLLLKTRDDYIEQAHDLCCGNGSDALRESCESFYQMNLPDDCSSYVPPVISISSGDPVIQTIDGRKYDFNGHGEYVFLTDGNNFEIQARTEYVVPGNVDSTYFSAFALLDKTSQEQIELHYDREADDIRYFRNGSYNSNCSASSMLGHGRPYPCEGQHTHTCFVLAGGGKIIMQNCGFKSYITQLVFGTDNFLSVQIIRDSMANITKITGLAGQREDGFYIMSNNTKVSENASALSFFQFGESWSLQNESQSIFTYYETGGNFTIYNTHHTRPEFFQDKLGNLTALFESFTLENITLFNKTCRNYWNSEPNNQCLLTIAKTGDYDLGLDVMKEANATRHKWEILHIDKCSVDYAGADKCEQTCTNTDGSFKCSCFNGYELNRDGHSCDDIDECSHDQSLCHGGNETCVNTPGNYSCKCVQGYYRSGGVCEKTSLRSTSSNIYCSCPQVISLLTLKLIQMIMT